MLTDLFITATNDWRHRAACRPHPEAHPDTVRAAADAFYPIGNDPRRPEWQRQAQPARDTCHGCPVRQDCLHADLTSPHPDRHGIVAGLDPHQRSELRRQRNRRRATVAA